MPLLELVPLIRRLTEGENLTTEEAELAFTSLEAEDLESYFYFTFLAALHTKGETAQELLGFCRANERFVPPFSFDNDDIVDISGTGGDRVKTPNISTAAAFVAAACGVAIVKQAFLAVTGVTGSADLLQTFGVDPLGLSQQGPEAIRDVFRRTGMVIYHANSMANPETRRGFFAFWLTRVPETGITFATAYHLAANVYSPVPMQRRVYGVFSEKYVGVLAEVFRELGYKHALVVHGRIGLDEISTVGETRIVEVRNGTSSDSVIQAADLGLAEITEREIVGGDRESNINDFLRVIYGIERGAKSDLVFANAGGALYVAGIAPTLPRGLELAREAVDDGRAAAKFEQYVDACGDPALLKRAKAAAGV